MHHATPIVYIVDDDISIRESLEALMRSVGWEPRTFASAEEFLALPEVAAPSCLVLDVTLPDLSGLELQKRIAAEHADLPLVFITGHRNVPMMAEALKAGAVEVLTKPFRADALLDAIGQALARSRTAPETKP